MVKKNPLKLTLSTLIIMLLSAISCVASENAPPNPYRTRVSVYNGSFETQTFVLHDFMNQYVDERRDVKPGETALWRGVNVTSKGRNFWVGCRGYDPNIKLTQKSPTFAVYWYYKSDKKINAACKNWFALLGSENKGSDPLAWENIGSIGDIEWECGLEKDHGYIKSLGKYDKDMRGRHGIILAFGVNNLPEPKNYRPIPD
jgi:hypothetical protein